MSVDVPQNPLFSVIVASYNNGGFLAEMIQSVQSQTYSNWELIIVDDASSDHSQETLQKHSIDHRIRIYFSETNGGVGATFKKAASHAKGEILGMLGADDALTPGALQVMSQAHIDNPEASLINSQLIMCDEKLQPSGTPSPFSENQTPFIHGISVSNFVTFKRRHYEMTDGFDAGLPKAVDHDLYLKLEEVGERQFVNVPLYRYRANPNGVSQGGNKGMLAAYYSCTAQLNAQSRRKGTLHPSLSDLEESELRWHTHTNGVRLFLSSRPRLCRRLIRETFRTNFPKALLQPWLYKAFLKSFWIPTVGNRAN